MHSTVRRPQSARSNAKRICAGFTLIELLVVIAIIGILLSLLIPAVQRARESARKSQCLTNLKQIGFALSAYLEANSVYPPSFCLPATNTLTSNNGSWSIHGRLLPYIEQGLAYDQVRLDLAWDTQLNSGVPTMKIATYQCPSEANSQMRVDAAGRPLVHPQNYGFNFGSWLVYDPAVGRGGDGSFYVNSTLTPSAFVDGLSHTLCAAEVKAFTSYYRNTIDPGPMVPTSPEYLAAFAAGANFKLGPNLNDNTGHTEWPDGRVHHSGMTTVFGPNAAVGYRHTDGRFYDIDYNSRQEGQSATQPTYAAVTARSFHDGFVNTLMMDGSARPISNAIAIEIWRAIGTRNGKELNANPDL